MSPGKKVAWSASLLLSFMTTSCVIPILVSTLRVGMWALPSSVGSPEAYLCAVHTGFSSTDLRNPSKWALLAASIIAAYALLMFLCSQCTRSSDSNLLLYALWATLHTSLRFWVNSLDHHHFWWDAGLILGTFSYMMPVMTRVSTFSQALNSSMLQISPSGPSFSSLSAISFLTS